MPAARRPILSAFAQREAQHRLHVVQQSGPLMKAQQPRKLSHREQHTSPSHVERTREPGHCEHQQLAQVQRPVPRRVEEAAHPCEGPYPRYGSVCDRGAVLGFDSDCGFFCEACLDGSHDGVFFLVIYFDYVGFPTLYGVPL